ncbi:aldo/keto reductase [Bifidobacterium phasiani]|uniref:Aldo/keto reductase n=1 Tax=Bifidobacterium phasiani TaxID=2834431 RepID=A0ABS6WA80_9BIFI|nr:aldo/keto reductase [Bifidobacterium phasiani]MBW3082666.1 aldo/keto reductase [Bifidobacterium phasiani]
MKYSELGRSGVSASRIALGVMRIADKTRDEAARIVETALNHGIDFFDSADIYAGGESSRMLGQALRDVGVDRSAIRIQTKFGISIDPQTHRLSRYDFTREHLLAALDGELERLGTDYVDFVLLHRPDTLVDLDELAATFDELASSGKALHFGVSNMTPMQIELLNGAVRQPLEVNQLQVGLGHTGMFRQEFHANMADADAVDHDGGVLAYSRLKHMTIQAWSPMQHSATGRVIIGDPTLPELNDELSAVAERHGVTPNAIAMAWILRHPAHIQAIAGTMNPDRLAEMAAGADVELTGQEWYDLTMAVGVTLP